VIALERFCWTDCFIDDAICGGVISFELCGVLFVSHFRKGRARDSSFFSIHKDGTKFGISNGRYLLCEYCFMAKKWVIGQGVVDESVLLPK
jgi:hypothetical protein